MNVIEIRGISKKFSRRASPKLLREYLEGRFRKRDSRHVFYALRDVSFTVQQAEGVQIVGANGAGKSTLLSVVTGLTKPDSGAIDVRGRVGALLELGSGFHSDLTGRENLALNAALIGINEARTRELTPKIIEFSELGDFIDEPLRTYSAGMVMRLAFSVAVSLARRWASCGTVFAGYLASRGEADPRRRIRRHHGPIPELHAASRPQPLGHRRRELY